MSTTSSPTRATPSPGTDRRALTGYATVVLTFMAAASAPTPLYAEYQRAWHFAPTTLTAVFAAYAAPLLLTLVATGALSDHLGRRAVVLAAMAVEAVALATFAVADGTPALFAARIVQGLATGAATGALAAAIVDADQVRGALVNSVAPIAGLAVGALGTGLLVTYAPAPRQLVYLVLLAVLAVQAAVVARTPDRSPRRPGALASLRPRFAVPATARSALLRVTPVEVAVWALGGFTLSLGPSLARALSGLDSPLTGGLTTFALLGAGAAAVLGLHHQPAGRILLIGAAALTAGSAISVAAVLTGSFPLLLAGTIVSGAGFGTGFLGAVRTIAPLAAPAERAGLMATFYVISYLAMSVPAVGAGLAVARGGLLPTAAGYGTVVALLSLAGLISTLRTRTTPIGARP
ncbi:MFS transporter [Catenuloplanes atrovinosus]|uniref:MFS transporter n=1 Tax=Catenuloplanes atrovinosus TaxID=137266 RepID=A0AAE3YRN0_9ACTN|nr:MFS transporter [Catenuloplanes atrovinosus]MDR7277203.1 hypothetical protein [Catenuloplanes atrovinosus]